MEQLLSYSTFINESNRPCVSFDFDGVLHKSVIGIHPTDMFHPETWTPSLNMFKQVKLESQNNDLVIVTARDNWNRPELETFVKMYNLPFTKIYFTNNQSKLSILKKLNVIRHYDDRDISDELKNSGIQFMLVDAKTEMFNQIN